ncbi:helix-turn-helix domain-containing protein, partial [Enterobacter hormaechei subsp. hoffmannii]|nr:helix-turn-helix domain-containing protein [Enterobacter hormaechei subsp. hoffmannii]MCU4106241.1 helix-turn-helix domain-containing protein [Enterobacter hormaechei subsp. hoffmannii]
MKITLTPQQKLQLEQMHDIERDSRVCDRIKAVLLASEGWSQTMISQALRIHESTVARHLSDYVLSEKLKPENGGSQSKLSGTVAKLAMRQPFVLFKGLTFQKLCLPGAFRPGDHHNKMLRPG